MIKDTKGFTLMEVLLSLSILLTALVVLVPLMNYLRPLEWNGDWQTHQYIQLLQEELNTASSVNVQKNNLHYTNIEGSIVSIEQYRNLVRRRVSGKGHETLLFDIRDMTFFFKSDVLHVKIEYEGGERFEKSLYVPGK
ncbi:MULTISPECIES: competence type IV pilus minor pilin ComGF [Salimicrobium]|uniref:Competence protein ComGF n=3 Tax=Salimicrobium TaxID=351195 RepID=K2GB42_9BACI|nr:MULTISPECIES: competence type IV pilus minor pilin ComGF [Salimicrobium]AKG04313.1 hypothetical protein AAV35_005625 [Salimicrobium jeotgali]EKE32288.1 hypothetical protein MJ3_04929 [Salimicrobium jeotgali]MBM7695901.1 competence protein ComGF [Salimicrobium jeotgali]SDX69222.1 competence protein ComGF [Salimicrobium album]SIS53580.1 competence protein ComGF [Salimicrobium salexigens]